MISRRGLLGGIAVLAVAPAVMAKAVSSGWDSAPLSTEGYGLDLAGGADFTGVMSWRAGDLFRVAYADGLATWFQNDKMIAQAPAHTGTMVRTLANGTFEITFSPPDDPVPWGNGGDTFSLSDFRLSVGD